MDYDLLVIGGGAAGKEAALVAARAGLKTLLVEKDRLGGTSIHKGCHVVRALQRCANAFREGGFSETNFPIYLGRGWADWGQARLDLTRQLVKDLEVDLAQAKVRVEKGSAKFLDNHSVEVSSRNSGPQKATADNIIIATGSEPSYPGDGTTFPFLAQRKGLRVVNSDDILENSVPAKHLVVLGGGFNGVEFASIYRALGSKVTLIEARETILPGWGSVAAGKVLEGLVQGGVTVKTGHPFTEEMLPSDCDMVLVATGRLGNTKGLALEKIGIHWGHFIQSTPELRIRGSEFSNIYAIGDVNGLLLFDSSAHAQARVAIQNILGKPTTFNLRLVPVSANTNPPVAFMGCTEPEVKASGEPYAIITEELVADGKRNLVKMLYHPGTRRFLSCLAIGPDCNEIVSRAAFMLSTNMPTESWLDVSAAYPSAGEGLVRALQRRFDAWEAFGSGFVEEGAQEALPIPREFPYHIWPRVH